MRVKHFITSINAHIDHLVGQIENHEAVAEATIQEARQLTAKIHSQLNQSEGQSQRLSNQIEELAQQESTWKTRAKSLANSDREKALRCVSALKQTTQEREKLQHQLQENQSLCISLKQHLKEAEQHLSALHNKKQQLSAREAKNAVHKTREQLNKTPSDAIFERWERQVLADEYSPHYIKDPNTSLDHELSAKEEDFAIAAELDALLLEDTQGEAK